MVLKIVALLVLLNDTNELSVRLLVVYQKGGVMMRMNTETVALYLLLPFNELVGSRWFRA